MKKIISLFVAFCIMLSVVSVMADAMNNEIKIIVNGGEVVGDSSPYIKNGRTMVPLRAIFEALGVSVNWDNEAKVAIGAKDGIEVKITIGEKTLYKNGERIALDVPAEITNDRTMVPLRAISEAFGATVEWDNKKRSVNITTKTEKKVIRIGTYSISEDDPYYTGESTMSDREKSAKKTALKKVEDALGIDVEFLQYETSDYTRFILDSIEKGEPACDLAILWSGSQSQAVKLNILQPIDDYTQIFYQPDGAKFPLEPKALGHYYFMRRDFSYINASWPIVYNIKLLDSIPGLKEPDGTTLYPAEMYYRGEWTWSNFEEYLKIIDEFCRNNERDLTKIQVLEKPFETNYTFFAAQALHSVGECVYDGENLCADSEKAIKACDFVAGLFKKGLVSCESAETHATNSGWISGTDAFINRKTCFTNCAPWKLKMAAEALGEGMGVVPFPYPDGTNPAKEKTDYRHMNFGGDSVGLVRGVDKETSLLAVKMYKMYMIEYCKAMTYSDIFTNFVERYAENDAMNNGIDINHREIGRYHVNIWIEYGKEPVNEYSEAFGKLFSWSSIFGKYAFDDLGSDGYMEAVNSMKN